MTELSTNSGLNHVLCQIETVSSQYVVYVDTVYLKRNLIVSWNCLIIFQFEYFILLILLCCNNSTAVLKFQASNSTLRLILYYLEYFTLFTVFHVLFLTFELVVFKGIRSMKHGRIFHFAGISLSKFIFCLKFEKSSRFFRVLFSSFKLKIMIFEVYET